MKKWLIIFFSLLVIAALSGCAGARTPSDTDTASSDASRDNSSDNASSSTSNASSSCDNPPQTFELNDITYTLKEEKSELEPGIKVAYMKCSDGQFTIGDAGDELTVYSVGSHNAKEMILLGGSWGRSLYVNEAK